MRTIALLLVFVSACFSLAPLVHQNSNTAIDGQYIVVFKQQASTKQRTQFINRLSTSLTSDESILRTYHIGNFAGFAGKFSKGTVQRIQLSPLIDYVEPDQVVSVTQSCSTQNDAEWGLDRVSEKALDLDGVYRYNGGSGKGVDAYIIDTGILTTHEEFGGRAIFGASFVIGSNTEDCNGHGTHVSGTVGGKTYGLAKQATLIAVKVLNCQGSGTNSGVISGVDWVASSFKSRKNPSLANMSLGGGASTALDTAVSNAIAAGVSFAIAAGNNNSDACNNSPARVKQAVTVGATTVDSTTNKEEDIRTSFSNYGPCLDVFAPGQLIKSAWIGANNATKTISGTSMASPHVAGAIALYLGAGGSSTPSDVDTFIKSQATMGLINLACAGVAACSDSTNALLYSPC